MSNNKVKSNEINMLDKNLNNTTKIEEVGSVQQICHKLFEAFLADKGMSSGAIKVSSADLYNQFLTYISENQYSVRPSNRAFGRAATKKLPHCKRNTGTHYLINK